MRKKVKMPGKLRGLKFKAVLLGFLVDTIGTLVIESVLATTLAARGLPETEIMARIHGFSGLLLMLILVSALRSWAVMWPAALQSRPSF